MKKILIADNEVVITELISLLLRKAGYEVCNTNNKEFIFKLSFDENIDLLICDYKLLVALPFDELAKLYKLYFDKGIAVILLGGKDFNLNNINLPDIFIERIISKPFTNNGMIDNIREAINIQILKNEIKNLKSGLSEDSITRGLDFKPQYKQAGISILSYFGRVVEQKYPDDDVKIKIVQEGNKVTLHIETLNGDIDKIEKTLDDYSLVVTGQKKPEEILSDPLQIMELKFQLQSTANTLQMTQQLLEYSKEFGAQRISSLEDEVRYLRKFVGEGMRANAKNQDLLKIVIESNQMDTEVRANLQLIKEKVESGLTENDKQEIVEALKAIQKKDALLLDKVKAFAFSAATGASGNLLASWISALIQNLPK